MQHSGTDRSSEAAAPAASGRPLAWTGGVGRTCGPAFALGLILLATAAAPAAADAGDASAVAARVFLSGTVLGTEINVLDQTLSEAVVSQGDADVEVTDNLLELELPVLGSVPLVSATLVSSTASSNGVRAEASSFLSDVSVNLGLVDLPLPGLPNLNEVLAIDAVSSSAFCPIVGAPTAEVQPPVTVTLLGVPVDVVLDQDIEVTVPLVATAVLRIGHTEVADDSAIATGLHLTLEVNLLNLNLVVLDLDLTIAESMCERGIGGPTPTEVFSPFGLEVDFDGLVSDANGVFEPGETVDVAPEWRNDGPDMMVADGEASNLTGAGGPSYALVHSDAGYGFVNPGATGSCQTTGVCYQMEIGPQGVQRPGQHWDATFHEELSDDSSYNWTLHLGDSFLDVPRNHLFYSFVETILHHSITVGCTGTEFCPGRDNSRDEMAAFMLRAFEGPGYVPPACTSGNEAFDDVAASSIFCSSIEELHRRGVVTGCGGNNFCPKAPISRAHMSVFLLRTLEGSDYTPPACSGVFTDVPCPSTFADWIEDLFARGVTQGCTSSPLRYCPNAAVPRSEMSAFITRNFELALYGL